MSKTHQHVADTFREFGGALSEVVHVDLIVHERDAKREMEGGN
jgi:hypothetical protein